MKKTILALLLLCPVLGISETTKQHELLLITRDLHKAQRRIELVKGDYGSGDDVDLALNIAMASIIQLDEAIAAKQKGEEFQNMAPANLEKYLISKSPSLSNGIPKKKSSALQVETTPLPVFDLNFENEVIAKTLPFRIKWRSDFISLGETGALYSDALTNFLDSLKSWQAGAAKIQFVGHGDAPGAGFLVIYPVYPDNEEHNAKEK